MYKSNNQDDRKIEKFIKNINSGKIDRLVIIGESGSGKTDLYKYIYGQLEQSNINRNIVLQDNFYIPQQISTTIQLPLSLYPQFLVYGGMISFIDEQWVNAPESFIIELRKRRFKIIRLEV